MLRPAGYFGCDDQLAHMTLSVLRQVYHQSNHSSRQMFSSHASRFRKHPRVDGPNHLFGEVQRFIYFDEQLLERA